MKPDLQKKLDAEIKTAFNSKIKAKTPEISKGDLVEAVLARHGHNESLRGAITERVDAFHAAELRRHIAERERRKKADN